MGLKDFLKKQGFITDESGDKIKDQSSNSNTTQGSAVAPTFFPVHPATNENANAVSGAVTPPDPSFVAPLQQQNTNEKEPLDATFVKLAMPPPIINTFPLGFFSLIINDKTVFAYSYVCCSLGAPEYSP